MSRIGRKPIEIPSDIQLKIDNGMVAIKGKLGEQKLQIPGCLNVELKDGKLFVSAKDDTRKTKSLHGLIRQLLQNMIIGVTKGYRKELQIEGVGFKATMQGKKLILSLGFSHPIEYLPPDEVKVSTEGATTIVVSGIDKQKVGEVAARIRQFYPPEPYKGKGIRYKGEVIRRKAGKTVA
jgi:large subunit ribosomal protein L6